VANRSGSYLTVQEVQGVQRVQEVPFKGFWRFLGAFGRAQLGRKLKGRAQGLNSGADIFLADASEVYVGRVCHYRECFPRRAYQARHCGKVAHLNDDLDIVTLSRELVARPPLVVYPSVEADSPMPPDVEESWSLHC
jgi:hypothetical protein